jgi:diacylglycerol kinase family enzyme
MVLLAAVGLHAQAIVEADPDRKRQFGALAYLIEALAQARSLAPFAATIEVDGAVHQVEVCAVTIANMAPRTTLLAQGPERIVDDDGRLDVTLVHFAGFAEAVVTALHLATRALSEAPADRANIGHFQARSIRVTTHEPHTVMIDGEEAGAGPLHVECRPRSLRVRVPAPA